MHNEIDIRYKPKVDRLYFIICIPTNVLCLGAMLFPIIFGDLLTLFVTVPVLLFVNYFLISPLFGYVELRCDSLLIKYGFFLKKEIKYSKIRELQCERRFYSESMMSLKNAYEHVNIKYNSFDVTTVSVSDNQAFIEEAEKRMLTAKKMRSEL